MSFIAHLYFSPELRLVQLGVCLINWGQPLELDFKFKCYQIRVIFREFGYKTKGEFI